MTKRKAARTDGHTSKPKRLRKRVRKAEARLVKAGAKRDQAQARVEALAIIADEIRAQLAEAERATADAAAGSASSTRKTPGTSRVKTSTATRVASKGSSSARTPSTKSSSGNST